VVSSVPGRLQAALRVALKQRDTAAVSALRSTLAAIGNAEALPAQVSGGSVGSQYVAGGIAGLGATEASRRVLTDAEIAGIVATEITERHTEAARYEQAGHPDRAGRLRREAHALADVMSGASGGAADTA
jgi:uncharacterized protein